MATRGGFSKHLSERLDVPWTIHNRRAWQTWMQSEGGSARNNPLNTTLHLPGSTDYNWVHVQNYPTAEDGLKATVETFGSPNQGYEGVLRSMRENRPARETVAIIGDTNWGTGKTLMAQVLAWIAQADWVLRYLERKQIAS